MTPEHAREQVRESSGDAPVEHVNGAVVHDSLKKPLSIVAEMDQDFLAAQSLDK